MMTTYERSDIIHIMKMNRLTLSDSDTAQMEFNGQVKGKNYRITILVVEDLPQIFIKHVGDYGSLRRSDAFDYPARH
jgi:mRNA-degrading endonuclease HigB of HigAB toxin-antitoxin module